MAAAKPKAAAKDRVEYFSARAQANSGTSHGPVMAGLAQAWATVVLAEAVAAASPRHAATPPPGPVNPACQCGHPLDMHYLEGRQAGGMCRASSCPCADFTRREA